MINKTEEDDLRLKPRVYYAHSMHLYNTVQEARDIQTLKSMGFEVLNPNDSKIQREVAEWKRLHIEHVEAQGGIAMNVMDLFKQYIDNCDVVAYRSHVDLKIPSGVMFEVDYALDVLKPVIELPTLTSARRMSHVETVEYLRYNGQR